MDARVYMNYGRWIVDCPGEGCDWAYHAMSAMDGKMWLPGQLFAPRPLTSRVCRGGKGIRLNTGGVRRAKGCGARFNIAWPTLDEVMEIEVALFKRPPLHRNWRWPETVDSLLAENDAFLVGWTVKDLADKGIGVI